MADPTVGNVPAQPGNADYKVRARTVDTDKNVQSMAIEARSAIVAAVPQDAAASELLAANAQRAGFVIENDSEGMVADLFVKFGAGASLTDYTRRIRPGECFERLGGYTGQITGIWSAAGAGKARVTEELL